MTDEAPSAAPAGRSAARPRRRARGGSPAAFVPALNEGKSDGARIVHEGTVPFGPSLAVERFRLGNGLAVLVCVDRSAPVAAYYTWFRVGSRHERPGKTGLAHLFEHLMFGGTSDHPAGTFDRKLEEAGADTNAATWLDWTVYHECVPCERLGLVVDLEAERMARLVLDEPQVAREKDVVANERRFRVEDDVEGAASEALYATAFGSHAYRWPTIGWMEDIQGFTVEDCRAFYGTFYAPSNATIVVTGDVAPRDVLARVQRAYGDLPAAVLPVEDVRPEPPQSEERRAALRKPTATQKLCVAWHAPAFGDADHAPLALLSDALFGGRSSRCHRAIVQEGELATELRGWVGTFRDPGLWEVYATARPGKTAADVLAAIDREMARVVLEPPTEEELGKVKARAELGLLQGLETAAGKAEQIGFYETVLGDPAGAFRRLEAYRRATRSDLLRAARRCLGGAGRTLVVVEPDVEVRT